MYDNDVNGTVVYDGRHDFAVFDVTGGHIDVEVWTTSAGNFDQPEIIDSFRVDTSAAMECGDDGDGGDSAGDDAGPGGDQGDGASGSGSGDGGCACRASGSSPGGIVLFALGFLILRRRRIL